MSVIVMPGHLVYRLAWFPSFFIHTKLFEHLLQTVIDHGKQNRLNFNKLGDPIRTNWSGKNGNNFLVSRDSLIKLNILPTGRAAVQSLYGSWQLYKFYQPSQFQYNCVKQENIWVNYVCSYQDRFARPDIKKYLQQKIEATRFGFSFVNDA